MHTMSSISAMTELAENGFGIATLPRSAAQRLKVNRKLRLLKLEPALQPLPVYASYRADPTSPAVETVVEAVFAFIEQAEGTVISRRRAVTTKRAANAAPAAAPVRKPAAKRRVRTG